MFKFSTFISKKKKSLILLSSLFCILSHSHAQQRNLTNLVNPFIGTDGFGHTFPGATLPFGMVQLSPDTKTKGWENCSGYHSKDSTIIGFSHTHLSGTGAADYGDILFMATEGIQVMPGAENNPLSGYRSAFKHETEKAKPGYYKVILADHGIVAEMTATTRCGFHKYTFPATEKGTIIVDLVHGIENKVTDSEISIDDSVTISGFRQSTGWAKKHVIYFYAKFSRPFIESGLADATGNLLTDKRYRDTNGLKGYFKFKVRNFESVYVKVGISTVSVENARKNLEKEIQEWDFNAIALNASNAWEDELNRIVVEGNNKTDKINFYTALYHTMVSPNIMSDVDGRYRGMDGEIHKMERGNMYTVFSLWDTFRALHPLYTIIDPVRAQEIVRALLQKYNESGLLPVWELSSNETGCMIGYHSVPVIVDTYMKGLRDFDTDLAYSAIKKSAMMDHLGMKYYKQQGYIPADKENESVSKTLEYAYDDWCILQMAEKLNKTDEADYFRKRANSFLNTYDKNSGFMRGKKNGNWVTPFDPYEVSGIYTEANAWQYTWFIPHNINGMISMMGGVEKFTERLDSLFSTKAAITGRSQPDISGMIGQYAHGNEPSHHMAYLYNFSNKKYKTAEITKKIMKEFYHNERDGLIGNEDCGQMSAWFVFSAMGIYPVCPGNNLYETGSPLFSKITVGKGSGNQFVILADSVSDSNIYVKSALLNGNELKSKLTHADIAQGGILDFKMTSTPSGLNIPDTKSPDNFEMVMIPYLISGEKAFFDSCYVEMKSFTDGAIIKYTTDGTEPGADSPIYKKPFYIKNSTNFKIKGFKEGMNNSVTESVSFIKLPYKKLVTYKFPYSHLYTAGGTNGLVDGIYGEPNAFGAWQGFYGDNFEVTIDLGQIRSLKKISTTFLQQYPSWIWLPQKVTYYISEDGKNYTQVFTKVTPIPLNQPDSFIEKYECLLNNSKVKFVKVIAENIKVCPSWHPGAGEKAWIFVDEVEIE